MKKLIYKIWFYLTHYKCEVCGRWTEDLYVYEYFLEAGILGCKECCNNKKN